MKFSEILETLDPLHNFAVEIILTSGESIEIQNIEWKKASLQLLQHHLAWEESTKNKFPLEYFCEYYEEYKLDPKWHHTTIAFLDRYNNGWGVICVK